MGYFYDQKGRAAGEFYYRETKARFEFRSTTDSWAAQHSLDWEIAMSDGSVRFARFLRTVAYVAVDVNDDSVGSPILERWPIVKTWCIKDG